jgi:ribosomal protein S18 acetylase RimI-like enzyme
MEITIEQIKTFSPDMTQEFNNLLKQLNSNSRMLSDENVGRIIEESGNRLFVAREAIKNRIVGMLTLVVINAFVAKKGLFEGIVVDKSYQGKGIGTKLINEAINQARKEGIIQIDFTSNPTRIAANKLYENLGFEKRDTNVYRIKL